MKRMRAHLYIEGLVQGVFYRAFVRELAIRSGLRGWVRNLPDGRVEAVFEGGKEEIENAVKECYKGPPAARVTKIDVTWEPYRGEFRDFEIRYF
ncbi:MAG: acylphosphatase [Nitrospirae bacterium]|nr:acylphosphatase [Nitrospirota bacterium]